MSFVKKSLKFSLFLIAIILGLDIVLVLTLGHIRVQPTHADAIIVLGAAINSKVAQARAYKGLEVNQQGESDTIVLSGGKIASPDISEAAYMAKVITATGFVPKELILEDKSNSTYENLKNTRKKIPGAQTVVIVTDSFHVARSVLVAKRLGFKNVYWASPDEKYFPKTELTWYYLREVAAMLNYIPKFLFG